jgi:hypothetical protein
MGMHRPVSSVSSFVFFSSTSVYQETEASDCVYGPVLRIVCWFIYPITLVSFILATILASNRKYCQ